MMTGFIDDDVAYEALVAHDRRFDGVFFVGVTSTGIYCRPVCPVKKPLRRNCVFFDSAELAEKALFRPCLRCRPELAPGLAVVDNARRISQLVVKRLDEGFGRRDGGIEVIAEEFGVSARQLRRIVRSELGVSPMDMVMTRRLLLAKHLLTETGLAVGQVAFASGFSSVRRFHDAFGKRYRMSPLRLRRAAGAGGGGVDVSDTSTIQLAYRPPYDWEGVLEFLGKRIIRQVEFVSGECYGRTVCLGGCRGWIRVGHAPGRCVLLVEFTNTLVPVLPALLGRVRRLFDLDARPDVIGEHLMKDVRLRGAVGRNPGLRVPGAFDGFETAVRAILGQQVSVKAATTLSCRFAEAFGDGIETGVEGLSRLSPGAERIAGCGVDEIGGLGIVGARAESIVALARAVDGGELWLGGSSNPMATIERLMGLPGIGPWTAQYIGMRVLEWPDAFPKEDLVLRRRLGGVSAREAEVVSQGWRPWRSYGVLHVWNGLNSNDGD